MRVDDRLRRRLGALQQSGIYCPDCGRDLAPEEPCFCESSSRMAMIDRALFGMSYETPQRIRVNPLDVIEVNGELV